MITPAITHVIRARIMFFSSSLRRVLPWEERTKKEVSVMRRVAQQAIETVLLQIFDIVPLQKMLSELYIR